MKIEIGGESYDMTMTGTVGLVYLAERLLPDGEELDLKKNYHNVLLWYALLWSSNKGREIPTVEEFAASLTTATMTQIRDYVSDTWARLEGTSGSSARAESADGAEKKS